MTISVFAKLNRNLLALLIAVATTAALAQEDPHQAAPQEQRQVAPEQSVLRLLPPDSITQHAVDTPDGKLDYTATAGTLSLFDQSGARSAAIFYTAYVLKDADHARRP